MQLACDDCRRGKPPIDRVVHNMRIDSHFLPKLSMPTATAFPPPPKKEWRGSTGAIPAIEVIKTFLLPAPPWPFPAEASVVERKPACENFKRFRGRLDQRRLVHFLLRRVLGWGRLEKAHGIDQQAVFGGLERQVRFIKLLLTD
jgi:hypothetical protein